MNPVPAMNPIAPMEPKLSRNIPVGPSWTAQMKWDGVRILTYYDGSTVRLLNRHENNRTFHYPELTDIQSYCKADSVIFDGEVIALGANGRPSFHEVMRRDGIRRLDRVDIVRSQVPIGYMVFDILYRNGTWLTELPLRERTDILHDCIRTNPHVQPVADFADGVQLFEMMKQKGMEGIVCKRLESQYSMGAKKDDWLKIKNYKDMIAVIGGFTRKDGMVNALLLGAYPSPGSNELYYIGHVGPGKLSANEWRAVTEKLASTVIQKKPFVNTLSSRNHVSWTTPTICVKVNFMEWTSSGSLRQPTVQAVVDAPVEDCLAQK